MCSACSACGGSRAACTACDGAYVTYNHEVMLSILAIEASRANGVVIGEDLGTVPEYVSKVPGRTRRAGHRRGMVLPRGQLPERRRPVCPAGGLSQVRARFRDHA